MELDRNYFSSIRLTAHRGKYYDVEAVDRLLVDIRRKADILNREILDSREKLAEAMKTADELRDENSNLLLEGQTLNQEILSLREQLKEATERQTASVPEKEEPEMFQIEEPVLKTVSGEIPAEEPVSEEPSEETVQEENSEKDLLWEEKEDFFFLTEELPDLTKPEEAPGEKEQEITQEKPQEEEPKEEKPEEPEEEEDPAAVAEARLKAEDIVAEAIAEKERILTEAKLEREKTVERMERVFSMLREISTYTIEKSERVHEDFLKAVAGEDDTPEDLSEKVGRIAAELSDLEEGSESES